ncbi:MAG TPA: hypothetical protein VM425_16215 [Myxococcota bacterium]|nr:hypothetical protein [Myxococcota bacterium]
MSTKKPINTDCDLVSAVGDMFDHMNEPQSAEDIDAFLRETGYEPDTVSHSIAAFVDDLIRTARVTVAHTCDDALASFSRRAAQMELPNTRVGLIDAILKFVSTRGLEIAAEFRNFEEQSDEDLREMLRELMGMEGPTNEEK